MPSIVDLSAVVGAQIALHFSARMLGQGFTSSTLRLGTIPN